MILTAMAGIAAHEQLKLNANKAGQLTGPAPTCTTLQKMKERQNA